MNILLEKMVFFLHIYDFSISKIFLMFEIILRIFKFLDRSLLFCSQFVFFVYSGPKTPFLHLYYFTRLYMLHIFVF